jgi:hypothetical protein
MVRDAPEKGLEHVILMRLTHRNKFNSEKVLDVTYASMFLLPEILCKRSHSYVALQQTSRVLIN